MPRNGSGVASAVPGTDDAVPNTVIESAKYDSLVADIYSLFNTAWPVTLGGTGGTSQISGWDAITAKGTDIASAGTINLTTATGPRIDITGTTTITAVTLASGTWRLARATGAFQITASATLLVNKSASVNYTTSAGDLLIFIADSTVVSVTAIGSSSTTFATPTQTVTGTSTTLAVNPLGVSAARLRRNRIPNPANQISTVNGNTAGTTNGYVPADGVAVYRVTSAGTITVQRVQSVTPKGSRDRVRITITAADASLAAGEYLSHSRNLTGNENADLQWGTASAKQIVDRFLFKGPAGTYAVSYKNYNSGTPNRSYVALFTPAAANTDEVITIVVPGDTSGTWETGTNPAIIRDIVLACGSTFQGTTGWQAGNILGTSAVSNGMGTIAQVFEIAEEGLYLDPESTGVPPAWELPSQMEVTQTVNGGPAGQLMAWINYNGIANTIRASGNVSSVTDNGAGDYTVNFTTALPDANYSVALMGPADYGVDRACYPILFTNVAAASEVAPTTSAARVGFANTARSAGLDVKYVCVSVFR